MSPGVWEGKLLPETDRVLILGESHYGDRDSSMDYIGEAAPYETASVVNEYLSYGKMSSKRAKWFRFFDKIVVSFGYSGENCDELLNRVYFGNYVPILCGVGDDNPAKVYIKKNRIEYNNQLFEFVNRKGISTVVCFSKTVFWNLPSSSIADKDSYREIKLPKISGRNNLINVFEYEPNVIHLNVNVVLDNPLLIYGIRHPSARGGYDAQSVFKALSLEARLANYISNG